MPLRIVSTVGRGMGVLDRGRDRRSLRRRINNSKNHKKMILLSIMMTFRVGLLAKARRCCATVEERHEERTGTSGFVDDVMVSSNGPNGALPAAQPTASQH